MMADFVSAEQNGKVVRKGKPNNNNNNVSFAGKQLISFWSKNR